MEAADHYITNIWKETLQADPARDTRPNTKNAFERIKRAGDERACQQARLRYIAGYGRI